MGMIVNYEALYWYMKNSCEMGFTTPWLHFRFFYRTYVWPIRGVESGVELFWGRLYLRAEGECRYKHLWRKGTQTTYELIEDLYEQTRIL